MHTMSKKVTRLLDQFVPAHYILSLHPDKKTMSFSGAVTITGKKVGRPSKRLTLHQKDLKITKTVLKRTDKQSKEIPVSRVNMHKNYDEVRLHADEMIYPGQYEIVLEFNGKITDPMNGLYPCRFTHDGKEKMLLATQFESHHAREVFPCIDEPAAKATFDLSLVSPKEEIVVANTPIKQQKTEGNLVFTSFETTPIMSSYLLAFVVGEMKHKEAKTKHGVTVRTYATPDKVNQTDFALDVAVRTLDFYDDYFAIPYPLEKCDMVALPDFASGAMENWGCITFREHCMLVDPKNTSVPTKQYVAMVMAHELAHQWFGNLVTMRWWTDLWLNEGFASWIEYLAIDKLFPEWKMWTQFIVDAQQTAMKLDALENTHPIEAPINHPDEIRTIFDSISYDKGASVIHMLHEYLGPQAFRDGLRYYLEKHSYKNTDTVDLWDALEEVSKKPVKEFMHQWTTQPGFPLLKVDADEQEITLRQQRFLTDSTASKTHRTVWPLPLHASEALKADTLTERESTEKHRMKHVLKINHHQSGFYRTVYNASHLQRLAQAVSSGKLDPIDRLGLLNDTLEAAKAGYTDTDDALLLLEHYGNETSSPVWDIIASAIGSIRTVMDDEELRENMKPYVRTLVAPQLKRLGWKAKKDEEYFDTLLRPTILGMASVAEEPSVVAECEKRFKEMKQLQDLEPDLRGVILNTVARRGDQRVFDRLAEMYRTSNSSEDQIILASALTSFSDAKLIKQSLKMVTSKDVRHQDVGYWVAYAFMNRHGKKLAWEWFKDHWAWLEKNLGSDMSFSRFPVYAARSFSDTAFLKDYKAFFKPHMTPSIERAYKQGIEVVEWQAAWKKRDLKEIKAFFAGHATAQ